MYLKINFLFILFSLLLQSNLYAKDLTHEYTPAKLINPNQAMLSRHIELMDNIKQNSNKSNEELSKAYGQLGMFYQTNDLTSNAIDLYLLASKYSPYNAKWYHLLSISYNDKGLYSKAINSAKNAIKFNEYYLASKIVLAETYLKIADLSNSIKAFKLILNEYPNEARSLSGLGLAYLQEGEYELALKALLKALSIQPNANQLHYLIAQAYSGIGNEKKSKYHLRKKGKIKPYYYDNILELMHKESRSSSYYVDLALNKFYLNDYSSAEKFALTAEKFDPQSEFPKYMLSNIYTKQKKYNLALNILNSILNNSPKASRAMYAKAIIYETIDEIDKSLIFYKKAVESNRNDKNSVRLYSLALLRNHKFAFALDVLRKAIQLNPNNPYLLYRKANILAYQNKCNESIHFSNEAMSYLPENFEFITTYLKIILSCDSNKKDYNKALKLARFAYQAYPSIQFIKLLAMIEYKVGNYQNAIDYQTQLIYQYIAENKSKELIINAQKQLKKFKNRNKITKYVFKKTELGLNPKLPFKF